jgi:hypothetical protein
MECEDAEMEDILDDILEQAKKFTSSTKKEYGAPTPPVRNSLNVSFRSVIKLSVIKNRFNGGNFFQKQSVINHGCPIGIWIGHKCGNAFASSHIEILHQFIR